MVNDKKVDIWFKFYQNLKLYYNISKSQFKEYNFIFVGEFNPDDKNLDLNDGDYLLPHYINYFSKLPIDYIDKKTLFNIEHRFIYKTECICEVKIKNNCFIYSKSKDLLLNIGGECCDKFNENKKYKSCLMCSSIHHNSKNNFCSECRSKLYFNCKKCKVDKSNNIKYLNDKLCYTCKYPNYINNTLYNKCKLCNMDKKEDTYVYCYNCNIKNKSYQK